MFEVKSYDELLESFLNLLPEDMDKREGTLGYIVGSAVAITLSELYEKMKGTEDDIYVDTATGINLERACKLLRIERRGKTKAVVKMVGDMNFSVGDSFTNGDLGYRIIKKEADYYLGECTSGGSVGNFFKGEVLPVVMRSDFTGMNIVSIVAYGEEEEDDESLRERFLERLNCPVCTGNLSYYKDVMTPVAGVGGIKVVPVHEGVGTVKVIITDSDYKEADSDLVSYVKEVLDPEEFSGKGYGLVPIGHKVTVESAKALDIALELEVTGDAQSDYYYRIARTYLPEVFKEINKRWDKVEGLILRNKDIEDYFFTLGVKDINVISINGTRNRFMLEENQILGGVSINGE